VTVLAGVATVPVAARVTTAAVRIEATGDRRTGVADVRRAAAPTATVPRVPTVVTASGRTVIAASTARGAATVPGVVTTGHLPATGGAGRGHAVTGTSGLRVRGRATGVGTAATPPTVGGRVRVRVTSVGVATAVGTLRVRVRAASGTVSTVARSLVTPRGRRSPTRCRSLSSTARPEGGCGR